MAACLVIEAAGRTAAYVPVVETMVYGALAIDRFGTDAQRKTWLSGVAAGETILTAAMAELVGEVIVPGGTEPADHGDGAGGRVLGARRGPRPACRRRSSLTPCWCPRRATARTVA